MDRAENLPRNKPMTPRTALPSSWLDTLTNGQLAIGYDIATSERGTANPSSICVSQRDGAMTHSRLVLAWKSNDPSIAKQFISLILDDLAARQLKPRRLTIDASSERYFATDIRRIFAARVPVDLVAGNQRLDFRGESMDAKTLLGNIYCAAVEDGLFTLPTGEWIELDQRLVKREGGRFVTDLGPNGEHGDTFDSCKLALWGLQSGGPIQAEAIGIGAAGSTKPIRQGIIGPLGKRKHTTRIATS